MTALASATPLAAGVGRRRSMLRTLALAGAGATVGATTASSQDTLAEDGAAIRAALRRWRELYSYGDKPFSFAGFEDLYDGSGALLAYDNFSDDTRTEGWAAYRALWEPLINASFTGQRIVRFDVHRVETSGRLGWSAIELWFTARRDGRPFDGSQYGTHVWRKADGRWRIVHEHMTGPVKVGGREAPP